MEREVSDDISLDDEPVRVRSNLPMILFLLVLGGGVIAGIFYFLSSKESSPRIVISAIEVINDDGAHHWYDGHTGAEAMTKELQHQLSEIGFSVQDFTKTVRSKLEGVSSPEEIREIAAAQGIGYVITGQIRAVRSAPMDGEIRDYSIEIDLGYIDVDEGADVVPLTSTPIELMLYGRSSDEAIERGAYEIALVIATPIIGGLTLNHRLDALRGELEELSYDEAQLKNDLDRALRLGNLYQKELENRAQSVLDEGALHSTPEAGATGESLGQFLAREEYVGMLADGRVLLHTEPHYLMLNAESFEAGLRRASERLVIADANGENRELVFERYNFYSQPIVSADGKWAAAVVDNRGFSKWIVMLDPLKPERQGAVRVHVSDDFTALTPAPDGSRIAYFHDTGRYQRELEIVDVVIDADGKVQGADPRVLAGGDLAMSGPVWSPDGNTLYLSLGTTRPTNIVAIDADTSDQVFLLGESASPYPVEPDDDGYEPYPPYREEGLIDGAAVGSLAGVVGSVPDPRAIWDPRYESRFSSPTPTHDGRYLIVEERDGYEYYIGRFDLETSEYTRLSPLDIRWMMASPTENTIAVSVSDYSPTGDPADGDSEIVLVDVATGTVKTLTANGVDDYLAGWSRDGKSVFVHRQSSDPLSPHRSAVRVVRFEIASAPE